MMPEASASGRVRVVPNRNSIGLAALLVAMWYAGASQNNGVAYLLCFVIAGVALVSILHTWANVRSLRVSCGPVAPVFLWERQLLRVSVHAADGRTHSAIRIKPRPPGEGAAFSEIRGAQWEHADVWIESDRRGYFDATDIVVSSLYPLGFFSARMIATVRQPRWVYPTAEGARPLPRSLAPARNRGTGVRSQGDDFAGVRAYVPGEPQRHIDWKAVARGQSLVIKQWAGEADEGLRLTWQDTAGLTHEARLSQLARWIVSAEHSRQNYALSVPGADIPTGHGDAHLHECLRTLASFSSENSP